MTSCLHKPERHVSFTSPMAASRSFFAALLGAACLLPACSNGKEGPKPDSGEGSTGSDDGGARDDGGVDSDGGSGPWQVDAGPDVTPALPTPGELAASDSDLFKSGSRLRIITLGAPGGSAVPMGFYDSELDTECDFLDAADGKSRCLPQGPEQVEEGFSDAACSQRVLRSRLSDCGQTPKYANVAGTNGVLRTYAITPLPASTATFYRDSRGCKPSEAEPAIAAVFAIGAEVRPDRFVSAKSEWRDTESGMGIEFLVGDDGTEQAVSSRDKQRTECSAMTVRNQGVACVPVWASYDYQYQDFSVFADAKCNERLAQSNSAFTSKTLDFIIRGTDKSTSVSVHDVRSMFDGPVYPGSDDYCSHNPQQIDGNNLYRYDSRPTKTTLTSLQVGLSGMGRIQRVDIATQQGEAISIGLPSRLQPYPADPLSSLGQFFDTERAEYCQPTLIGDKVYCIPKLAKGEVFFSDPECKQGDLVRPTIKGNASAVEPITLVQVPKPTTYCNADFAGSQLASLTNVLSLGELFAGPAYQLYDVQQDGNAVCQPAPMNVALYRGTSASERFATLSLAHD